MADFDFPPLLKGEGPSLDAASIIQAQAAGEWAQNFGEHGAGKNNLMTRKRHNADIARETEVMQQAQEQAQLNRIRTNKTEQDLWIRSKKLDMDLKVGEANLALREQTFTHKEQMLPAELEAKRAATNAAWAREKATTAATAMKAELEKQKDEHTAGFVEHMKTSRAVRGTKAFEDFAVDARMKFPGMDHVLYQDVVKTHGSGTDPDEALKLRQTALTTAPNATVTTRLDGGVTITDKPANAAAERTFAATQLSRAQARKDRATKAADDVTAKEADEDIAQWSSRFSEADAAMKGGNGLEQGLVAPAAVPTVKSAADFGSLPSGAIFIDPNGVRRKKP